MVCHTVLLCEYSLSLSKFSVWCIVRIQFELVGHFPRQWQYHNSAVHTDLSWLNPFSLADGNHYTIRANIQNTKWEYEILIQTQMQIHTKLTRWNPFNLADGNHSTFWVNIENTKIRVENKSTSLNCSYCVDQIHPGSLTRSSQ